MLKLVGDEVQSIEQFMTRYRVRHAPVPGEIQELISSQMDNPAALHRIQVGVPATVEHSTEAGPETAKQVAETTQVRSAWFQQ